MENDNLGFQIRDKEGERWESGYRDHFSDHLRSLDEEAEGKCVKLEDGGVLPTLQSLSWGWLAELLGTF